MKRHLYLLLFSLFVICLSSCKKNDVTSEQAAIDDAKIQAYIKANNITVTKDPSGIYYQVIKAGPDTNPSSYPIAKSTIQVSSTGKLLNGTTFNQHTVQDFLLSSTIKGWQIGIPHINTKGRLLLIVPSALGYGATVQNNAPANSVLVFTIDLIGFY